MTFLHQSFLKMIQKLMGKEILTMVINILIKVINTLQITKVDNLMIEAIDFPILEIKTIKKIKMV